MDGFEFAILEMFLFFILLIIDLYIFRSLRFEKLFRKDHVKEAQLIYIFTIIIFSYLLTRALMNLIELMFNMQ